MTNASGNIAIKRIYDDAAGSDGYRILVDRLWPRGVSKERASLGEWMKEMGGRYNIGQINKTKT